MSQRNRKNIPIFVALISIILIVIIIALTGNGGVSPNITIQEYPTIIPESTKVLTPSSTQYLSSVSPDGRIFTFSQSSNEIDQLLPGDVIVSSSTSVAPYGFLQRVLNISQLGEQVIIQTEPASLTDAIESGTVRLTKRLTQADLAYIESWVNVPNSMTTKALYRIKPSNLVDDKFFFKFEDLAIWDNDGNLSTTGDQVRVNGEVAFGPEFNLEFALNRFQLDALKFSVGGELEANTNLVAGAKIKGQKDITLKTLYFQPIVVLVGHVPVVIVPVIDLIAHIDVSLEGGLKLDFTWKFNNLAGASYERGRGWKPIGESTHEFSQKFLPTLKGKITFYPDPYLRLRLYNTLAISTAFNPYVKATIDPFMTPCWELSAGLKVPVGIQAFVFDKKVADFNMDVIGYEISVAKAQSSCFAALTETASLPITETGIIVTSIPINTSTPFHIGNASNSSTAMLFDVSGSMGEQDVTAITKMEAAKHSGERILDIIQAENSVSQGAEVGILSFSNGAWVNASPSADVDSARSALLGLYPLSGTGMPDGLRLAIDQFSATQNSKPIIIMLSDGLPNVPLASSGFTGDPDLARQQSLDLASEAGTKGICIYTVGFGVPSTIGSISGEASIDEDFLKQVAANSGCGVYYNAQDAIQLANVYVGLRHESTGNVLLSQTGNIAQDETVDIANVQVPDNQSMILYTLNWPGSQLDAVLTDPGGTVVDANYPNASFSTSDTLASIIIQAPQAGEWNVAAKGVDVPEGSTVYNAVMSVRPNPNPPTPIPVETPPATIPPNPGFPVVILMLVLAGGGVAIYVMVQTRGKGRTNVLASASTAQLIGIGGELTGQAIILRDGMVAGRGSGSSLKLKDRTISRQHVKFRFANGQWFVQDMSSQTGVFLNGVKVQATVLKHGDRIRIGPYEFEFRTTR